MSRLAQVLDQTTQLFNQLLQSNATEMRKEWTDMEAILQELEDSCEYQNVDLRQTEVEKAIEKCYRLRFILEAMQTKE